VLRVSGKTGEGVSHLLDEIVRQFDPPVGDATGPARAMIFDSVYDVYRGVVTYVRVIDGRIEARDKIKMMSTGTVHELLEIGVVSPEMEKAGALGVGEVGRASGRHVSAAVQVRIDQRANHAAAFKPRIEREPDLA